MPIRTEVIAAEEKRAHLPAQKLIQLEPPTSGARRVAVYCRVSTKHDDQSSSISAQQEHFMELISANPEWELVEIFIDRGITGTRMEARAELLRMLDQAAKGRFDLVLTKSVSRFARNTLDCLNMVRMFRDLGVEVFFEAENLSSASMEGEMVLSVIAALAEEEARQVSNNAKWAATKRFLSGTYKCSRAPYGYVKDGAAFRIDPGAAAIVQRIFAEAIQGKGGTAIAKALNAAGIPGPSGGKWGPARVCHILRDPVYTGVLVMQKTYTDESYRQHVNRGEVDRYVDGSHHPLH